MRNKKMNAEKMIITVLSILVVCTAGVSADLSGFEDLTLVPESYWNGSDGSGGFTSESCWFNNNYNTTYGSWDGWAYSNVIDNTTPGWSNQYSAIRGSGVAGSDNYGVGYWYAWAVTPPTISLTDTVDGKVLDGAYFTNATYTYYSMLNGDTYSKKFGGPDGTDPDWFKLTIKGIDASGEYSGSVDFYLADFRFADDTKDYIVDQWTWVDLTSLGAVIGLEFGMDSSDVGDFGINTPTYFAIDALPEPATVAFLTLAGIMGLIRHNRVSWRS